MCLQKQPFALHVLLIQRSYEIAQWFLPLPLHWMKRILTQKIHFHYLPLESRARVICPCDHDCRINCPSTQAYFVYLLGILGYKTFNSSKWWEIKARTLSTDGDWSHPTDPRPHCRVGLPSALRGSGNHYTTMRPLIHLVWPVTVSHRMFLL